MIKFQKFIKEHWRVITPALIFTLVISALLLYHLGTLTGGISSVEVTTANTTVGWHGIYHQPLYLPLEIVRSVIFSLSSYHGQFLTRLPNAMFGGLAIVCFALLIYFWHGTRTMLLTTILFACAAWTLHTSRLASFDVLYLCTLPVLLLTNVLQHRFIKHKAVYLGSLFAWALLLYIPGMVWLIIANCWWQRKELIFGWRQLKLLWQQLLAGLIAIIWLPLLILDFWRTPASLKLWLGLPATFDSPGTIIKHFIGVFVHLFIRGPEYPANWLGRTPILDLFSLVITLLGIYFYAQHVKAARSRVLIGFLAIGAILVSLGGLTSLSLLVPLLYIWAAAGLAYLLREWLTVFPLNPFARGLGIGLVSLAVAISCLYNLRAYFVAWPNNPTTQVTFRTRR